jgi:hypothetical protein
MNTNFIREIYTNYDVRNKIVTKGSPMKSLYHI